MQLEIITPESQIFKGDVESVQFPGLEGSFQVLKGHAPIISALRDGDVKVKLVAALDEQEEFHTSVRKEGGNVIMVTIKGGVVEMLNDNIILLAE